MREGNVSESKKYVCYFHRMSVNMGKRKFPIPSIINKVLKRFKLEQTVAAHNVNTVIAI